MQVTNKEFTMSNTQVTDIRGREATVISLNNEKLVVFSYYTWDPVEKFWAFDNREVFPFYTQKEWEELIKEGDRIFLPKGEELEKFLDEYPVDLDALTKCVNGKGLGQTLEYRNRYDDVIFTYSPQNGFTYEGWCKE